MTACLHSLVRCQPSAGVLDEKASASQVLGLYAEATGALFAPHIEDTLAMLQKMASYFHSQVREQAYISLPLLLLAASQAFPSQTAGTLVWLADVAFTCDSGTAAVNTKHPCDSNTAGVFDICQ